MRAVTFLQNLISEIGLNQTSLDSIRISTNRTSDGFFVRFEFIFLDNIFDLRLADVFFNHLRADLDKIFINNEDLKKHDYLDISSIRRLSSIEFPKLGFGFALEISEDGYRFDLNKVKNALILKTFYGLDKSVRKYVPASKVKIFFGAGTYQPIDINLATYQFSPGVESGQPFSYSIDQSKQIRFIYLKNGVLSEKKISFERYLTQETKNELDRYKIKIKFGLQIHTLFDFENFIPDLPLKNWKFLLELINQKINEEITSFRVQQVSRLENRTGSIHRRRRVFFNDIDLGVEPKNETETVLLFERAFPYLKNRLPEGLFIRLLDYSPRDIDAVCEFTPSSAVPSKITLVEFEYDLKSFFDHGHDLRQVSLIICYKMDNIRFPYHCYGSNYVLEENGSLMILKDGSDPQVQAYCLVLKNFMTLR